MSPFFCARRPKFPGAPYFPAFEIISAGGAGFENFEELTFKNYPPQPALLPISNFEDFFLISHFFISSSLFF
jgi:hypothetical protein